MVSRGAFALALFGQRPPCARRWSRWRSSQNRASRHFRWRWRATEEQKATGLMYRKELADGRGMLFDFSPEQPISMWMKNTFISLDMIFIGSDGRITRIAENTEPQSTRIISSGGPAKAVLEVIGRYRAEIWNCAGRPGRTRPVQEKIKGGNSALPPGAEACIDTTPVDRGIAQPGSAAVLGTAGPRFESLCPDHFPIDCLFLYSAHASGVGNEASC